MRISKGALLVVLAFTVPLIVELRTVLVWVNVDLSVLESAVLGLVIVGLVVVWAFLPEREDNHPERDDDQTDGDVPNGN
ncbi:CbaC protein [Natronorubrum sp. DTA28]|uniref:CbaC protein n=1 Tax=Natronorubrum sp. DTA28 TaxID=3447019 RepID=UPI003F8552FD